MLPFRASGMNYFGKRFQTLSMLFQAEAVADRWSKERPTQIAVFPVSRAIAIMFTFYEHHAADDSAVSVW